MGERIVGLWGWDPKETGSFIAWCVYGAYLHLRRFGFIQARGAAWLSVVGFVAVLFTMIGVSFFLPGLHSYRRADCRFGRTPAGVLRPRAKPKEPVP